MLSARNGHCSWISLWLLLTVIVVVWCAVLPKADNWTFFAEDATVVCACSPAIVRPFVRCSVNATKHNRYAHINMDDVPLYVFDWAVYDDKIGREAMAEYRVPPVFEEDLFQLLEEHQHEDYPSYR